MLGLIHLLASLGGGPAAAGPPDGLLAAARGGDRQAREDLIRQYTPLVLRVGAQVTGRYLQVGRDEEVSVGLLALNEAIDRYDPSRGASFATFAELVIRRRLTDHFRRGRGPAEVPLSELEQDDGEGNPLAGVEEREAIQKYLAEEEARDRREEIARYARRLLEFGIRFADLVQDCPRHADARERAMAVARLVAADPQLRDYLLSRKQLPLAQLEGRAGVSRKTLERQRRYIIAVALLLVEDYYHLRRYIQ